MFNFLPGSILAVLILSVSPCIAQTETKTLERCIEDLLSDSYSKSLSAANEIRDILSNECEYLCVGKERFQNQTITRLAKVARPKMKKITQLLSDRPRAVENCAVEIIACLGRSSASAKLLSSRLNHSDLLQVDRLGTFRALICVTPEKQSVFAQIDDIATVFDLYRAAGMELESQPSNSVIDVATGSLSMKYMHLAFYSELIYMLLENSGRLSIESRAISNHLKNETQKTSRIFCLFLLTCLKNEEKQVKPILDKLVADDDRAVRFFACSILAQFVDRGSSNSTQNFMSRLTRARLSEAESQFIRKSLKQPNNTDQE